MDKKLNEYQDEALRTANVYERKEEIVLNAVLGLNGEAGELADILKKARYQGHSYDREHLIEELGDVLWYCSLLAFGLNIYLSDVAERNLSKLMTRYPKGFEAERSKNRNVQGGTK